MKGHELKRESVGKNEMRTTTPTCSCGWVGKGYAAYNNYQGSMIREQEAEHLRRAARATA